MGYDFKNDWLYLTTTGAIPQDVADFLQKTFFIEEIRQKVGKIRGIKFEVRTKEKNHVLPHVHAEYDSFSITIGIDPVEVLDGNLPAKHEKIATRWVGEHKEELLGKWIDIAITATSITTKSMIGAE